MEAEFWKFLAAFGVKGSMHLPSRALAALLLCLSVFQAAAQRLPVSQVVIIGQFATGPAEVPVTVASGGPTPFDSGNPAVWPSEAQMRLFFANGGTSADIIRLDPQVSLASALRGRFSPPAFGGSGLLSLLPDCGLLVIPQLSELPEADLHAVMENLRPLAASRHFLLLLDPPSSSPSVSAITTWAAALPQDLDFVQLTFPRLLVERHLLLPGSPAGAPVASGGSGAIAAITTRMDQQQGLWKTPSSLNLVTSGLEVSLTTNQSDSLNLAHINPLRLLGGNYRLFGSRTRNTSDPEKRFTTVNRLERWTSHSLARSLASLAALSANDETLWATLRSRTESHLQALFLDGALAGITPSQAFYVRCDATTSSPADIAAHPVRILYGLAPLRASEFQLSQLILSTADPARPLPDVTTLTFQPGPSSIQVYFPTFPGFTHTLEQTGSPGAPAWPALTTFQGDGAWHSQTVSFSSPAQFLRIRTR